MHRPYRTPTIAATARPTGELDADLLVIPVFQDDDFADEAGLDAASDGELVRARERGEFRAKLYDVFVTPVTGWKSGRLALIGAGPRAEFTADRLRRIAIAGGLAARQRRMTRVAVVHRPGTTVSVEQAAQVMAEGVCLANFEGASFKTDEPARSWLKSVELRLRADSDAIARAVERGTILGESTNQARTLSNEPGNVLPPRVFAERAMEIAADAGLTVEVLDERRIAELKMGLLLGVAQGSQEPPRVVVLRHEPANAPPGPVLGLVGKGITFDTGGISIKPAENMDKMKDDMSGGAAVICAMAALSRLKAPLRCIGVVPMAENMPGGRAVRPGDVLTSAAGKTVEIINTDAEGRLILGDAVWYARQLGATHVVDVATLTGACVVALGKSTSGVFGSPAGWVDQVLRASERAGDRSWPMPLFEDYKEQLKSEIADFTNTGGRPAGAVTAALFIREFIPDVPWAHIDIAGTAWAEESKPYQPKGATGVAVRTLAELALDAGSWSKLDFGQLTP